MLGQFCELIASLLLVVVMLLVVNILPYITLCVLTFH